ncbi:MAG TPA: glycosyltransferase family 1 protein [Blastocatellia bacterium]|nr:glycosyltransferase family 1 protein [Blastocatellia bacterium]
MVCLSHLRWDFVYQRPQHLLSRFARERRVFFVEEPIYDAQYAYLDITQRDCGVWVVVPHLPTGLHEAEATAWQQSLIQDELLLAFNVTDYILWYYTPLALAFTRHLEPLAVVYDCMDELSAFKNAPPALKQYEAELFERADVVFTGGHSLYEAKALLHPNVHPFPSSIDAPHFRKARTNGLIQPADQSHLPAPRLGFCGVIDERLDRDLLAEMADMRPEWQFVMVGPVVKIDPSELPRRANIHYLGGKSYDELPHYLAGWDIALLPFARNEATRYISPTKTPEYLAAGVPAISTAIRDVVRPWGESGLVKIGDTAAEFVAAAEYLLSPDFNYAQWLQHVDKLLAIDSWDRTWSRMAQLVNLSVKHRYPEIVANNTVPAKTIRPVQNTLAISPSAGD